MEHWNDLYKDWLAAFQSIGTPAISPDTAARILAITYVHGNNEAFVYNKKYLSEIDHIKSLYHIEGSESPDPEIVVLIQQYVKELEQYRNCHAHESDVEVVFRNHAPEWAKKLFMERYGIKLIN